MPVLPPELRIKSVKPSLKRTVPDSGSNAPDVALRQELVVAAEPSVCTTRFTGMMLPLASAPPVQPSVDVRVRVSDHVPDASAWVTAPLPPPGNPNNGSVLFSHAAATDMTARQVTMTRINGASRMLACALSRNVQFVCRESYALKHETADCVWEQVGQPSRAK